jgi:hypothetical protein
MKYISALVAQLRPLQMLISLSLAAVLVFTSGLSALAAQSDPHKGIDQLPQIEEKSKQALESPPMSLKDVEERSQGALNEVQPDAADRDKMYRSDDSIPPVVKQAERALGKLKQDK